MFFMNGMELFALAIASFRLTRLIVYDKITEFLRKPFFDEVTEPDENGEEIVYLIPKKKGFRKWMGELLSCHWCTGIWVSAFLFGFLYLYPFIAEPFILILAVAGIAAIIETIIGYMTGHEK